MKDEKVILRLDSKDLHPSWWYTHRPESVNGDTLRADMINQGIIVPKSPYEPLYLSPAKVTAWRQWLIANGHLIPEYEYDVCAELEAFESTPVPGLKGEV